jgi:hypothetical protein
MLPGMSEEPAPFIRGDYALTRQIAQRLVRMRVQPYADDCAQYVLLHGEREGEVVEFGPPLRAHRMFPTKTRSKAQRLATEFATYAAGEDQTDWRVWAIHYPSRKTALDGLVDDLKRFNRKINTVFTQLRKNCGFELLLLGIHIEFDHSTHLFDIHGHFVCKIADEILREEARRRLMTAFSRTHTPDGPLRSPPGFANYAARTYKLARVVGWPDEALLAAWHLINQQFRYVRTGRAFAEWQRRHRIVADPHQRKEILRKRENRKATRYEGNGWKHRDKPLFKRTWKFGDEHILGTLYRAAPSAGNPARAAGAAPSPYSYSSASGAVSQSPSFRQDQTIKQQMSTLSKAESASGQNLDEVTRRFGLAGYQANMVAKVYRCNGVGPLQVTPDRSDHMSNYITQAEAHTAADRVDADGKKASAASVRDITGHGSYSTITAHLKSWVPRDQRLELPPVPDGLMSTVSALTLDLWHMARTFASEEHAAQIAQATADTAEAQAAAAAVGGQADRLAAELGAALERVAKLEKLVAERDQQIGECANYVHQLEIDAARKDTEIETLRRTLSEFAPAAVETRKSTKLPKGKVDDEARPAA